MIENKLYESLKDLREVLRSVSSSSTIVYTYGAWDLFHPGHLHFLERAKELGDFLIAATVSDVPIKELKGKDRPIQLQNDRATVVSSLSCVDAGILQKEYAPSEELLSLQYVNILTKGDDWDYIPGTETIESMNGKLVTFSYTSGYSTSGLIKKIRGNF